MEGSMNRVFRIMVVPLVCSAALACKDRSDPARIMASGHVEATRVRISTKVGGRLEALKIAEGDNVASGQELARIDVVDLRLALQQSVAERDQAAAELRLQLAGPRREDVAELEAQLASVEVDLADAERDLKRMQALLDHGSGTTKARDDAQARRDMATAKLAATREALARLRAGSRAEEKDAARARLAAAEARIAQLEQQMKDAVIVSPLSGVVTEKIAEQGELLQSGSPLSEVTNLADAWLNVYLPEAELGRIRIGQPAEVTTDSGQKRAGKVSFVASQAEFTPKNVQTTDERVKLVYKVKIALDNADGVFKPGMPAEASLEAVDGPRAALNGGGR
jgi:HlyD family secretion protein